MTTEADLVAAITANPDDDAGFLVYADFLQANGDPRGELITLMHAGAKDADAFLRKHKSVFVGALAKLESSIKLEAWRLGFVDHVRIVADDEKHALLLLDHVALHPSCRFARKLEIVILGKRRSYAGVDARLVELAAPQTLKEIVFGKTNDYAPSPALYEMFPLFAGKPKQSWEDVAEAIVAAKRAAPAFDPQDLAFVTDANGLGLPIDPGQLLRGLANEVAGKQPIGLVAKLHEVCTPEMLDAYGASLVTAWTLHGEEPASAWTLDAASMLGGAQAAAAIGRRIGGVSHARAEHAITCLARMRSPLALLELYATSRHWGARGEIAEAAVASAARRANLDHDTLLARSGSDPRDAFDDATLARFRELDLAVVERLMATRWSAPFATVCDLFARAPRREWVASLVWRAEVGRLPIVFAFDDDRAVDHTGRPIDLAGDLPCSLVHVAEPAVDLDAWRRRQPSQPFAQLARSVDVKLTEGAICALVTPHTDIATLRVRGYRNAGMRDFSSREETAFRRRYDCRSNAFTVTVRPGASDLIVTPSPGEVPEVVWFEMARDLMAARR